MTGDSLEEYRRKRELDGTPEPSGQGRPEVAGEGPVFAIQKHDASRLHYDLRLEVDGVLKSWAVPKGPSLNPAQKRLAVPTEDHPLDYADFEGTIPEGNYGAGTVMVWDIGTYQNTKRLEGEEVPLSRQLENGQVEVRLNGEKLAGGYALIRTGDGEDARWLLIKMNDEQADRERDVTAEEPRSALSGRTLEQIAEGAIAEGGGPGGERP